MSAKPAPAMQAAGRGVILNLGSISWHLGLPELSLYETAKAGIEGMTRALARELGADGVRVACIVPGNVKTPRQMKWYTPEGEAEIVAAQCLKGRIEPRDVAALAQVLTQAQRRGEDIAAIQVLERYQEWRRFDTAALVAATDLTNRLFSNDNPLLRMGRDIGMGLVGALPGLRRGFIREAAGLSGDLPDLMR